MKEIEGGITAPCGFKASGVHCGIKRNSPDLALIFSKFEAIAAGMFTINKVKAAPVVISQKKLRRGKARAIVANSGNANACTGKKGFENANRMCKVAARELGIDPQEVLVASTGVIGEQLPIEKIEEGIKAAAKNLSSQGSLNAAQAIITTDKKIKQIAVETEIPGQGKKKVKIGAIAKGSGMIAPNLATMLCFITTDACITLDALKEALRIAVDKSFNQISVDGDMSTNDTVIALANGKAGNKTIKTWKRKPTLRIKDENFDIFCKNLEYVCAYLAKEIVRDGEGATKIFEVKVEGAPFPKDARRIARKIATSNLVKTALAGASPNWGRIMAALGSAHTKVKLEKVDIIIEDIQVVKNGEAAGAPLSELRKRLLKNEISIVVKLNQGNCNSTFWGCDLTEKYVKINKRYL
ncbi:MAG TPA: bifunctional glutamate N-acetyltransferase/amino-acid acetyltransferase ArgJ [Candidatus Aerophobetes bacterium]|uniref:Arginine biosynthesis bifunctional protein ArgJ n=1 Tax=Aerophobetes bacterium TaxID=2030807 RepID=A0A7V5HZV9_UNCAE|nr:bifunctional glutamate N-acetyltransferase/amino-acid acetyltransferase ArgJ [Candidatus Aerophobetes bacterium]